MALRATCAFPFYRYRCIFHWIIAASLAVKLEPEAQKSHVVANRARLSLSFRMAIYVFLSSIDRSQRSAFTHNHGIAYLCGSRGISYRLSSFGKQLIHWVAKTRRRGNLTGAWRGPGLLQPFIRGRGISNGAQDSAALITNPHQTGQSLMQQRNRIDLAFKPGLGGAQSLPGKAACGSPIRTLATM